MDEAILSGENAIFLLVKAGLIIFLLIYVVFAAVVIRQARMMTDTLEVGFETQIKFLVLIHFALAVLALVLSFIIL